jgi:hypothetical protein
MEWLLQFVLQETREEDETLDAHRVSPAIAPEMAGAAMVGVLLEGDKARALHWTCKTLPPLR